MKPEKQNKILNILLQTGVILAILQILLLFTNFVEIRDWGPSQRIRGFHLISPMVELQFLTLAINSLLIPMVLLALLLALTHHRASRTKQKQFNFLKIIIAMFSLGYGYVLINMTSFLSGLRPELALGAILSIIVAIVIVLIYVTAFIVEMIEPNSIAEQLKELAKLKEAGLITEEDFEAKKKSLLKL